MDTSSQQTFLARYPWNTPENECFLYLCQLLHLEKETIFPCASRGPLVKDSLIFPSHVLISSAKLVGTFNYIPFFAYWSLSIGIDICFHHWSPHSDLFETRSCVGMFRRTFSPSNFSAIGTNFSAMRTNSVRFYDVSWPSALVSSLP